jgi:hypothetical protein
MGSVMLHDRLLVREDMYFRLDASVLCIAQSAGTCRAAQTGSKLAMNGIKLSINCRHARDSRASWRG